MFTSTALLIFDGKVLRGNVREDLALYYRRLYYYDTYFTVQMSSARYGTHITIYNPTFHGELKNKDSAYLFHKQYVKFEYDPTEIYQGGQSKGFIGFYLPVYSEKIDQIQKFLGIDEAAFGRTLHISLFNNKSFVKREENEKNSLTFPK